MEEMCLMSCGMPNIISDVFPFCLKAPLTYIQFDVNLGIWTVRARRTFSHKLTLCGS